MDTLQALQKRIRTTTDLLGVVKTMKSLAAVNIRHFERAARSLEGYRDVVDKGWDVLFLSGGSVAPRRAGNQAVILAVGSDQGMCGSFNEVVLDAALKSAGSLRAEAQDVLFWSAGERMRAGLQDAGFEPERHFAMPGTLAGANESVETVSRALARWERSRAGNRFHTVFNSPTGLQGYEPRNVTVLPIARDAAKRPEWPSRCLPKAMNGAESLFAALFGQHLFVSLYGALARSLAAENAARLAAMQAAEKNIMEMRDALWADFRQTRQNTITGELLDIVSGFEAMTAEPGMDNAD
ncbi:F0F1 ATP synthase subunit gamma [Pseudodesulfovibrio tunisiensis]|uniref:F0F1 ATP synthase subunit gamma n=1 Tax=Pseudodesulfovibrio tunisiensis TaxID=463192 RepID=UPI001FB4843B|nr:F0F1 ATP synthase subunit gamma [Pseudodesulfovibrio tunisiensis]